MKLTAFFLSFALLLLASFASLAAAESEESTVAKSTTAKSKVLALLPLSGAEAGQGLLARQSIELALERTQIADAVEVAFQDSRSDSSKAITAYKQALAKGEVHAVISLGSPTGMALSPLVNRDRVLLFAMAATPAYKSPNDFTYRIIGSADQESEFIANVIQKTLGFNSVGILHSENAYGEGTARAFKAVFEKSGTITGKQSFLPGSADLRAQLLRLKTKSPQVLFIASWGLDAGLAVRQAQEIQFNAKIVCSQACVNPDLITGGKEAAEGILISAPSDTVADDIRTQYESRYGETLTFVPIRIFWTVQTIAMATEVCRESTERSKCLREALHLREIKDKYPLSFDLNGDMAETYVVTTVDKGRFSRWKAPSSEAS